MNEDILHLIGNTPLVRINRLNPNPNTTIYAKIEGNNPTGSIKDRIALSMIEQAEREGTLTKGKTIIEPTSGNTGVALAMIGVVKGYQVEIVMSNAVSAERMQMIRAFGGKVTLTDGKLGTDGAIRKARELAAQFPDKYFMPDQFSNEYNKIAHYRTTGEEIWRETKGQIDYFVSAIGTSGTIMGVGQVLREHNPRVQVVCAHPVKGHYIQGLKNMEEAIVPSIYDPSKIDTTVMVETEVGLRDGPADRQEGRHLRRHEQWRRHVRRRRDRQADRQGHDRRHLPGPRRKVPLHPAVQGRIGRFCHSEPPLSS